MPALYSPVRFKGVHRVISPELLVISSLHQHSESKNSGLCAESCPFSGAAAVNERILCRFRRTTGATHHRNDSYSLTYLLCPIPNLSDKNMDTALLGRLYDVVDNRTLWQITSEDREELQQRAHSRDPSGEVFRARLILALADGMSYREIERKLGASAPTVSLWKGRFEQNGVAGLKGQHKGSKPKAAAPVVQARVIRRVQQKPADGSTHWSCRKLATALGLRKSTVQRILARNRVG
jgi:homeodomain-containing protein